MTYRNQPAAKNLPPVDLADGRSCRQWVRDVDERYGVIEAVYQVFNPATGEWESERQGGDVWDMWAGGYDETR